MRILYGVQGTGNGHITRARVMSVALARAGMQVDYLFSGREPERYFNMEPFGDYRLRQGLTLVTAAGKVLLGKTLVRNNLCRLWRDAGALDLSGYDLVISDFEPVSAWAARRQKVASLGIAHQYAFCYPVPGVARAPWFKPVLQTIAPVQQAVGVHWHHFDAPILPPLIEPQANPLGYIERQILVYLPFEALDAIKGWLSAIEGYRFVVYCAVNQSEQHANLQLKPFSRSGFQQDLASCDGVICNAGFGLCSEAIQSGKKLLVKPLANQIEQAANAAALEVLERAQVIRRFDAKTLLSWLAQPNPAPFPWPDTASALVEWIADGRREPVGQLAQRLWQRGDELAALSPG